MIYFQWSGELHRLLLNITIVCCERIFLLKEGGLSVRQIMRVMELEKDVKHGYLPFTEKDVRNLFLKANVISQYFNVFYLFILLNQYGLIIINMYSYQD
jgi:hypothetical protein